MREPELRAQLENHHSDAFGWALSCCGWERSLAEDVLQSSYLKVLEGKAVFAGRSSFKTWLFAVIRRTAAEHRRRQAFSRLVPLERLSGRLRSASADPEEQLLNSGNAVRLVEALKVLPKRQREVLCLVFYSDLTIGEAGELLGISLGTARTHYERGKQRLRELLTEERRR